MSEFDLAVIGGGIGGVGVARDAAGRGLKVFLAEQGDLGNATSSASTKLIHGGLRYLEHFQFRLVRESLQERERLMVIAPHLVRPMRFVMPHVEGMRPAWKMRIGLAVYDWFGKTPGLAGTRALDLSDDPAGAPLAPGFRLGFEYSDCITDDSRLVIANAIGAREKGAIIRPRTRCVSARREDGRWELILQADGKREIVHARALVNASGAAVARVQETILRQKPGTGIRLVKGSHIVIPRLHAHDRAYLLPNDDGRFIFAIPFAGDFTLVGTTDVDVSSDSAEVSASSEEILYLCRIVSRFFRTQVKPSSVKWTFAGVRTLVDDGKHKASEVTRDYWIDVQGAYGDPPLVSIYGGKLTTYRGTAEKVVDRLRHWMNIGPGWTASEPLPGGDLGPGGLDELIAAIQTVHPYVVPALARRLARAYGTRVWTLLGSAARAEDLGHRVVGDLHARELDYLRHEEWAVTADDVLWRRTKLGLTASAAEVEALHAALAGSSAAQKLAG